MTGQESGPELTVVIPTRDRHDLVEGAVESALNQTIDDVEVVVVDDGSVPPVELTPRRGVRCVRRDTPGGLCVARNAGLEAARGRFVTFLDDDDRLLPHMAAASLEAIGRSTLPGPLAAISGIELIRGGRVVERRFPPTHPRGEHFSLEPPPAGRSHMTKGTLVAERELLREIGGWDEGLLSRQMSDLLWRLNPVCSIVGLATVTRRVSREPGRRLSRDAARLEKSIELLVSKHRSLLEAHPGGYADVWLGHARMSIAAGPRRAVLPSIARAFRIAPRHTLSVLVNPRRMGHALLTLRTSG